MAEVTPFVQQSAPVTLVVLALEMTRQTAVQAPPTAPVDRDRNAAGPYTCTAIVPLARSRIASLLETRV